MGAACADGELGDKVCETTPVSFKYRDGSILVSPCKEIGRRKGDGQHADTANKKYTPIRFFLLS